MRGEKVEIKKYHTTTADNIARILLPRILQSPTRYVIAIAGESGAGKTAIAHELAKALNRNSVRSILIQQDDYFRYPPRTNYKMRRKDISIVGTSEVKLSLLDKHAKSFKNPAISRFRKPLIHLKKDTIGKETIRCKTAKVLIIEGTYTTLLKNADIRIFIARTFKDTLRGRLARKRERIDSFNKDILSREHKIISSHKNMSDIIVKKDFSLINRTETNKKIKRICMLTVHGYVDPKPILGKIDTGGQVTYVLELSRALGKKGIKVDIYTRQFQNKKTIESAGKNVRIIRIPCGGRKFIPKEKLLPYLDTFAGRMAGFIKKQGLKYDIFHSHYWDAGYVAMRLCEHLDYFFVHTFHSLGAWKRDHMGGNAREMEKLYRFKERIKYEKLIFRKTRALVMTSTAMVRSAKTYYGYRGKNYIVLPAGVNTDVFRPLKKGEKEKKIDVPHNYMFWVGRFDSNKGLDYLLRAFAEIVTKDKDLFLVIGGGSEHPDPKEKKLRKKLEKIIEKTRIKNRVFFTNHIKDNLLATYYRKAKFFVLCSKFEPFGMTAAEAMACGTAAIISKRAGIRKYLKPRQDCLIVNPFNKRGLSRAFQVLNRNSSLRKKIAKGGLKIARDKFSWTHIVEKSLNFYADLVSGYK